MSEWKPIESAPRDGTWILIWTGQSVYVAAWLGSGWDDGDYKSDIDATHWMPLPPPPEVEGMSKHIINSDVSLQETLGMLRQLYGHKRYIEVSVKEGKGRSVEQNAVLHGWFGQVARELREDDARGVKRFCKLHFGVPILRAEDDDFREAYDSTIKPMAYEQKLIAMDILPVTSAMTTMQLDRCMTDIQSHYQGHGVALVYPKDAEVRRAA